jgi:hypothetical protein
MDEAGAASEYAEYYGKQEVEAITKLAKEYPKTAKIIGSVAGVHGLKAAGMHPRRS